MTILKILYTDELSILNYTILLSVYITSLNQVFFCVTVCVCVSFVLQLLQNNEQIFVIFFTWVGAN